MHPKGIEKSWYNLIELNFFSTCWAGATSGEVPTIYFPPFKFIGASQDTSFLCPNELVNGDRINGLFHLLINAMGTYVSFMFLEVITHILGV